MTNRLITTNQTMPSNAVSQLSTVDKPMIYGTIVACAPAQRWAWPAYFKEGVVKFFEITWLSHGGCFSITLEDYVAVLCCATERQFAGHGGVNTTVIRVRKERWKWSLASSSHPEATRDRGDAEQKVRLPWKENRCWDRLCSEAWHEEQKR